MLKVGKRKLILAIAGILIVVVILFLMFSQGQNSTVSPSPTPTVSPAQSSTNPYAKFPTGQVGVSALPSGTATVSPSSKISPTPSVTVSQTVGVFDWSKNINTGVATPVVLPDNIQAKIDSNDPCVMADLSDSWSNPFEKTLCGLERTFVSQIMEPLYSLTCNFYAAGLATTFGSNITGKMVNSQCMIEDRQ